MVLFDVIGVVGYLVVGAVVARTLAPYMLAWGGPSTPSDETALYGGLTILWPVVVAIASVYAILRFLVDAIGTIVRPR